MKRPEEKDDENKGDAGDFRRALPLLFLFALLWSFIFVLMPIYLSEIGFSGYEIGLLVALYAITPVFVSFPTGVINDRWTIRLTMIAGICMVSAFMLGLGFLKGFIVFIPLFFLGGLGNNLEEVSIRTLLYKTKMEGKEGKKFGLYNLVNSTARSAGLFIGGILIFMLDFSLALKIIGILYLLIIPFASFRPLAKRKVRLAEYKKDFLNSKVVSIGIIMFLFALHWGAEATSFGLFLRNNLGLDMFMVGVYSSVALLFLGFTAYFFGRRIDRGKNKMKNVFFAGVLFSGVFGILYTIPIPWISFLFRIPHEMGDGMASIAMYFWISKLFGTERIGGNSSLMFTLTLLGQVTGSLVFGPIGYVMGYQMPFIISGATTIICAFLLLTFVRIFHISEVS
jgi:MFS family permease